MTMNGADTLFPGPSNPGAPTNAPDQPDAAPLPIGEVDKSGVDALRPSGATWNVPGGVNLPGTLNTGSGHRDVV
jgi:hypothetical protein